MYLLFKKLKKNKGDRSKEKIQYRFVYITSTFELKKYDTKCLKLAWMEQSSEWTQEPVGRMMSSYVVWWGQLPLVKDGAGCKTITPTRY